MCSVCLQGRMICNVLEVGDDVESANSATTGNVQCANVLSEVVGG